MNLNPLGVFRNKAYTLVSKADESIKQVKQIKTEREQQKERISSLKGQILGIKQEIRGDAPTLTKAQKEVLTRSKEAANDLMAEKKAVRTEVKFFGEVIHNFNQEIKGLRQEIQDSSNKIDHLFEGKNRKFWQKELSPQERKKKTQKALENIKTKQKEIQARHYALNLKQKTINGKITDLHEKLAHLQSAGKGRLEQAAKVHSEYNVTKKSLQYFKKSAKTISSKSLPDRFEAQLQTLKSKMDELKTLESHIGQTAIDPSSKAEQDFLKENKETLNQLSKDIGVIKKDLQEMLEGGTRKKTVGERIKQTVPMVSHFQTQTIKPETTKKVRAPTLESTLNRLMPYLETSVEDYDTLSPATKISMVQNHPADYVDFKKDLPPTIQEKFKAIEKIQSENPDLFREAYQHIIENVR